MTIKNAKLLFWISALYDFVIGAAFLFAGTTLFENFQIPTPDHWGYIHFCCLMLMIFGCMFATVASNPVSHRNLIPFGILLKASYIGVVSYYWLNGGVPWVFQPFLFIDAVMLVAFVWAYFSLRPGQANTE